jgi:hypothetical protein
MSSRNELVGEQASGEPMADAEFIAVAQEQAGRELVDAEAGRDRRGAQRGIDPLPLSRKAI